MKHALQLWYRPLVVDKAALKLHKLFRGCRSKHIKGEGWSGHAYHVRNKGPWVAKITGLDLKYGLARTFLEAEIDHSEAVDARECKRCWVLDDGAVYEVKEDTRSGREDQRYFVRWIDGEREELTREQVLELVG